MIYFRHVSFLILVSCFLISCTPKEEPPYKIDLLTDIWQDQMERCLREVANIENEVEMMGRRPLDVEVLNMAVEILDKRRELHLPQDSKYELTINSFDRLDEYQGYLESIRNNNNFRIADDNWEAATRAIDYFQSQIQSEFDLQKALHILLNLAYFESELIFNLGMKVGVSHSMIYGIVFNYNVKKDTLKVGEEFEMIISPNEVNSNYVENYNYESAKMLLNDSEITDFDIKVIGSSAYVQFIPSEPGLYKFEALFKSVYDQGEYVYDQPVIQSIVVLE